MNVHLLCEGMFVFVSVIVFSAVSTFGSFHVIRRPCLFASRYLPSQLGMMYCCANCWYRFHATSALHVYHFIAFCYRFSCITTSEGLHEFFHLTTAYESDPSSGSFNPQAHTTWVPVDWSSWPNYNVHGYGIY